MVEQAAAAPDHQEQPDLAVLQVRLVQQVQ
jgi:hypothetical protein